MEQWTIYCHTHIESGRRYVGMTKRSMMRRWSQHVTQAKDAKNRWHFPNAIRKYGKDAFSHEILEVCDTLEVANTTEIKWIEFYDTCNPQKGFNVLRGEKHKPGIRGNPWQDPSFRSKVTSAIKRVWQNPDYQQMMSEISTEAISKPEIREKISVALRGRVFSSEHRAKISNNMKGRRHDPEILEKIAALNRQRSNESRKKSSEITRANWTDSVFRAKMLAANKSSSSEVRNKIRASSLGRKNSEESCNKLREHYKKIHEQHLDYLTHYHCKHHGSVLFNDCYKYIRSNGNTGYRCKQCICEYKFNKLNSINS